MSFPDFNEDQRKLIANVLSQISADALLMSSISGEACARDGDAELSRCAQLIAKRIGAMADHTLISVGLPSRAFCPLEDWIMPEGGGE